MNWKHSRSNKKSLAHTHKYTQKINGAEFIHSKDNRLMNVNYRPFGVKAFAVDNKNRSCFKLVTWFLRKSAMGAQSDGKWERLFYMMKRWIERNRKKYISNRKNTRRNKRGNKLILAIIPFQWKLCKLISGLEMKKQFFLFLLSEKLKWSALGPCDWRFFPLSLCFIRFWLSRWENIRTTRKEWMELIERPWHLCDGNNKSSLLHFEIHQGSAVETHHLCVIGNLLFPWAIHATCLVDLIRLCLVWRKK